MILLYYLIFKNIEMIRRVFKFGLVGISGVIVGLVVITLCVEILKINPRYAWYISTFFATLNNFIFNNYYTWKERKAKKTKEFTKKITFYYIFSILSIALNYLIYNVLLNQDFHYFIALGIAIIICAIVNFILNELFIWPKKKISD